MTEVENGGLFCCPNCGQKGIVLKNKEEKKESELDKIIFDIAQLVENEFNRVEFKGLVLMGEKLKKEFRDRFIDLVKKKAEECLYDASPFMSRREFCDSIKQKLEEL